MPETKNDSRRAANAILEQINAVHTDNEQQFLHHLHRSIGLMLQLRENDEEPGTKDFTTMDAYQWSQRTYIPALPGQGIRVAAAPKEYLLSIAESKFVDLLRVYLGTEFSGGK